VRSGKETEALLQDQGGTSRVEIPEPNKLVEKAAEQQLLHVGEDVPIGEQ
jgi:hypothetical protein